MDSLVGGAISNYTRDLLGDYIMGGESFGIFPDFLASGMCLAYAMLLGLGVKTSATVNSLLTIVNLAVMVLVVVLGIYYADITNWASQNGGLLPYGFGGVITGEFFFLGGFYLPLERSNKRYARDAIIKFRVDTSARVISARVIARAEMRRIGERQKHANAFVHATKSRVDSTRTA